MKIAELLQSRTTSKANSNRATIVEMIVQEMNKEREAMSWQYFDTKKKKFTKLGFITGKMMAIKLAHVKTEDLMDFYNTCLRYSKEKGSFSKCMFGSLKVK